MRQRMMILAAGLFAAFASAASAQSPAPLQTQFASQPNAVAPVSGCGAPVVVNGCGSCAAFNVTEGHKRSLFHFDGGVVNPAGVGCFASDKTFLFGSSRDYFNPQHTCGCSTCGSGAGGIGGRLRNPCSLPVYGNGIGQPANNCAGPYSYIMR